MLGGTVRDPSKPIAPKNRQLYLGKMGSVSSTGDEGGPRTHAPPPAAPCARGDGRDSPLELLAPRHREIGGRNAQQQKTTNKTPEGKNRHEPGTHEDAAHGRVGAAVAGGGYDARPLAALAQFFLNFNAFNRIFWAFALRRSAIRCSAVSCDTADPHFMPGCIRARQLAQRAAARPHALQIVPTELNRHSTSHA